MRKSLLLIPVLAGLAAISACGNSSEKGRTLARIAGAAFTDKDLDLRLHVHEDARRAEILADADQRRGEFEAILNQRLFALAAQASPYGKSADIRRRMDMQDQRVMTQYYFESFLGQQGGYTRAQIEAHHAAAPDRYTDDSGRVLTFPAAFTRVVDSLLVKNGAVDSFFQANAASYSVRPYAEVAVIRTTQRKQADAALKALRGGAAFDATAKRYSQHASRENGGRLSVINRGDYVDAFSDPALLDSLVFGEKRLKPGQTSGILTAAGGAFLIVRAEAYTAEKNPSLDEVRARVNADFVREHKARLNQNAVAALKAKYELRNISLVKQPTEKEIAAYYEAHKSEYESPETFELYHIEAADEAKLTAELAQVKDFAGFKALAARISSNAQTRTQEGRLGVVKRDFSLPYGVGMMPALFPALDEIESGRVEELVQNPTTQAWHAFWLVKKEAPQPKTLERVRPLVIQDLKANRVSNVQPKDSLAVIGKLGKNGKVIREEDVLFLRGEIPPQYQERYTRENLVEYIAVWEIFAAEARALGLDKENRLRAQRLASEDNQWAAIYRDSVLPATWEESPSALDKAFKANRALFGGENAPKTWKPIARDVAASLYLTPRDYELEYNIYPERYTRDSALIPFAEAKPAMFTNLKQTAYARLDSAVLAKLKKRFKVKIEDPTLGEPSLEPVAAHYKKAQDLHYERKLDQAMNLYERLRTRFPKNAGLQDSVSFGIAQILIEQERYGQALAEYRRVNYLYPNSPNDYKALFMIGFIQAEHLRQDSAAVRSFEAMLKKYPDSDLSDDADWMIRNIRSGGQLMPTLEEDLDENGMSTETAK